MRERREVLYTRGLREGKQMAKEKSRRQKAEGSRQKAEGSSCLVLFVYCLLPGDCLLLSALAVCGRRLRLRSVVNFACFHDVSLVIVLPVAVNVNLHYDLV